MPPHPKKNSAQKCLQDYEKKNSKWYLSIKVAKKVITVKSSYFVTLFEEKILFTSKLSAGDPIFLPVESCLNSDSNFWHSHYLYLCPFWILLKKGN
jgi:hypothetical protein